MRNATPDCRIGELEYYMVIYYVDASNTHLYNVLYFSTI
jgi:hypothetical protein